MVRKRGFEPPRGCPRQPLKLVRLPFRHFRLRGPRESPAACEAIRRVVTDLTLVAARAAELSPGASPEVSSYQRVPSSSPRAVSAPVSSREPALVRDHASH